jgi:hypothetical protein
VPKRFAGELGPLGLILRLDGGATSLGKLDGSSALLYGIEDALRPGTDAVVRNGFPGPSHERASHENMASAIRQAHPWVFTDCGASHSLRIQPGCGRMSAIGRTEGEQQK